MIGESFVRPSHQHTGRESVQLDGLAAEQESVTMQLFLKDNMKI